MTRACAVIALAALAGLCACSSSSTVEKPVVDTGLDRMERLALNANRCWFKSKDPVFAAYSLAPELSSYSGRPRFLLVPRGHPEARPLLVVEGQSGSSEVAIYGPLTGESSVAPRVQSDLARWRTGRDSCSA
ncbi:hypothetical protein SAMN05428963_101178 [Consotaella salsifontis]|uniref:Lipoprotein n=2 Tax=Consotaella salsifontis TaxID=1365950 RepID=A0A1T4LDY6_9HYPH|nr:hypothetical protein SAMN05428963_101178 [Consotaella salsifontis]